MVVVYIALPVIQLNLGFLDICHYIRNQRRQPKLLQTINLTLSNSTDQAYFN